MKKTWNKYSLAGVMIAGVNVIVGIVMYFILNGNIAIQWSGTRPASVVSKNYIFLFPLIAVAFFFVGKVILQYVSYKWFKVVNHVVIDYANMFLQVLFITCQLYTVLYAYGFRITIAGILIIEIVIGILGGMRLRKNEKENNL